jgi:hypothetical protein
MSIVDDGSQICRLKDGVTKEQGHGYSTGVPGADAAHAVAVALTRDHCARATVPQRGWRDNVGHLPC